MTCASKLTIGISAERQFDDAQFFLMEIFLPDEKQGSLADAVRPDDAGEKLPRIVAASTKKHYAVLLGR
jgi:hypothetical protein